MSEKGNVRESALAALHAFRKDGAWLDLYLKKEIEEKKYDRRDAALLSELAYGVLQHMYYCDYYINLYADGGTKNISPVILDILRISVYQLLFLDRMKPSAIVNEGVELAKKKSNPAAVSFTNAVLRKISSEMKKLPPIERESDEQYLSVVYSHPRWFVRRMLKKYGAEETEKLLAKNNERPDIVCRVNSIKVSLAQAIMLLYDEKLIAEETEFMPNAVTLGKSGDITKTKCFIYGMISIQDEASQAAVYTLRPEPGDTVIDMCAAPGGKSMLAAQYMKNEGTIFSFDTYDNKLKLMNAEAKRLGAEIVKTAKMDGTVFNKELEETADKIICDVPCSGMGVIRKKPDIRYKCEMDIAPLAEIQKKILSNALKYLKKGGTLVYSTCSILDEENCDVVNAVLNENEGYELKAFELPNNIKAENGMLTLLPHVHQTDGFFIAKIIRI